MGLPPSEAGLGTCVFRVQTPSETDTLMPTWGLGPCLTLLMPEPCSPRGPWGRSTVSSACGAVQARVSRTLGFGRCLAVGEVFLLQPFRVGRAGSVLASLIGPRAGVGWDRELTGATGRFSAVVGTVCWSAGCRKRQAHLFLLHWRDCW